MYYPVIQTSYHVVHVLIYNCNIFQTNVSYITFFLMTDTTLTLSCKKVQLLTILFIYNLRDPLLTGVGARRKKLQRPFHGIIKRLRFQKNNSRKMQSAIEHVIEHAI